MTPALQEKAMKGHSIYLAPSLSSQAMESCETLDMGNTRPVKEKIMNDSLTNITCSVLRFPTPQANHSTDCLNLKYLETQSSKHYPLLMSSSPTLSVNKNCMQRNSEEHNCSKMRNPLCNNTNSHFRQIINPNSGEQVRRETLLGTTKNLQEMERQRDSFLSETSNAEERQFSNCKWYRNNGLFSKTIFVNPETKKELFDQEHHNTPEAIMNCSPSCKQQELNFRLLQCVNRQQVLLSRAIKAQKHLQILLAKHVVKHCDQQMKCFVRHQLQRIKVLDSSHQRCATIKIDNNNVEANTSKEVSPSFGLATGEIKKFAHSTASLLSQVEESLDSEATCSSSSDDDGDEQISRRLGTVNYRSDWKWLVDRAKIGCRWTWLQAQISELEYKIQQLTDLHRQIRATKGMVILEEFSIPKDVLKKQAQLTNQEGLLNITGNSQAPFERQDAWPEHDFETSPSSPTLLLRNIEKQSAQLSEIISSLIAPLNLSPTSSPLFSKPYKQKELVNGISGRESRNNEEMSSSSWVIDQQHLKKRRKDKMKLKTSAVAMISTSARTRPLHSFQRRKLYKMSSAFSSYQQAMQLKGALFNTEEMVPASMWSSCAFRTQRQLMLDLDSSFHPVLSFASDIPLHVHFKKLLKKYEFKENSFETSALGLEFQMSPTNEYCQHKAPPHQWNCGYEFSSKHQGMAEVPISEGRRKRHLRETVIGESNNRCEAFSFPPEEQESHSHFAGSSNGDMMSRSSHSTTSQLNSRWRLRSESSYDIDNIVIPMSLVAPSKLEKLQYKEILTPSWRTVSLEPLGSVHGDEEKAEDLSDDVYAVRHAKYEDKERARWSLWEQWRWPRRNRSGSRSSEGQDQTLKEKLVNSGLTRPPFSENNADSTSKIYSSVYLGASQSSERNQVAKSILWERRTFPLKDKEAEALVCQHTTSQQKDSNVTIHSDSDCTSYSVHSFPKNSHSRKKSSDEVEECNQVYLGNSSMRRQT